MTTARYDGRHYQLTETVCVPAPVQERLPILVGGTGERKTLRFVAEYADACNLFRDTPDAIAHKLDVLRGHCDAAGTDYDAIEKTMIVSGGADPLTDTDGFLREMADYAALGISLVTMMPSGDDPVAWATQLCDDVVPRLAEV